MMNAPSNQFEIQVTRDIRLTTFQERDQAALVEFLNDQDIYDVTLRIPFPYTKEDAANFISMSDNEASDRGHPVHFAIRDESDQLLGAFGLEGITYGHRAEIGYWLGKPYWGRGIMTEVVRAACQFAASEWRLVRITAHVFDGNAASARVLEKNGFAFEGLLRKYFCKDGEFIDSRSYALFG